MAQEHGLNNMELFAYLVDQDFIFRYGGSYWLNKKGFEVGGKYHQSENGQIWIVWHKIIFTKYVGGKFSKNDSTRYESNKGRYLMDYSPESWLSTF